MARRISDQGGAGELLELIGEAARKKGKYVKVSLNWPQSVLQVSFVEEEANEKITMEEANEGEKFAENEESNL